MINKSVSWVAVLVLLVSPAFAGNQPKNVILLIGDGLADAEMSAARNYTVGAGGSLEMDRMSRRGVVKVYHVEEDDPSIRVYVGRSETGGTAIATGQLTSRDRVSTAPGTGADLPTILELAQASGLRTGLVTTSNLTDATPAVFASHINHRRCNGPEQMIPRCPDYRKSEGGAGSIAEQMVDHQVDLMLGGGDTTFGQEIDGGPDMGLTVYQSAEAQGYAVVGNATELAAATAGTKLLGVFAGNHMTRDWTGLPAMMFPSNNGNAQRCYTGSRPANEPTLLAMMNKALELLDSAGNNGRNSGFFLMVEGANADKAAHAGDPCGQIGETIFFDRAVKRAQEYAKANRDTLVIVVADHAHGDLIIPPPEDLNHPTAYSILETNEGALMALSYGSGPAFGGPTGGAGFQTHTGTQVPVLAMGPDSKKLTGVIDQTKVFDVMAKILKK